MRTAKGAALVLALVALLACESGERGAQGAAAAPMDTTRVPDTAAAVGDTVMARDTVP